MVAEERIVGVQRTFQYRRRVPNGNERTKVGRPHSVLIFGERDHVALVMTEYAEVITMLGDRRCECKCTDGKTRTGTICGSMRKRVWVRVGDLVCVSLRGYQDDKCDITYKYTPDEVEILKRDGSLAMLTPPPTGEATVSMSIPIPTETDPDVDMLDFSTI